MIDSLEQVILAPVKAPLTAVSHPLPTRLCTMLYAKPTSLVVHHSCRALDSNTLTGTLPASWSSLNVAQL